MVLFGSDAGQGVDAAVTEPVAGAFEGDDGGMVGDGVGHGAGDGPVTEVFVPEVDVVDTTGAGDSLDAGYIAALCHGVEDEDERMRWATAAGSLSTRGQGGTAGQPDLAELRATVGSPAFV